MLIIEKILLPSMTPLCDFITNNLEDNCQLGAQVSTANDPQQLNIVFRLFYTVTC